MPSDSTVASRLICPKLCTWLLVMVKCPASVPTASHRLASAMRRLLAPVLRVGMVSRALTTMMTRPLSAGTSSSTWCDSSLYRNRPTTSSAHTMEPMHSDAWDALMRRLDGSTEYAVCSTNCWHTCTTSAANTQNSRLCSSGGNPTTNTCMAPCQIETISSTCSRPFLYAGHHPTLGRGQRVTACGGCVLPGDWLPSGKGVGFQ